MQTSEAFLRLGVMLKKTADENAEPESKLRFNLNRRLEPAAVPPSGGLHELAKRDLHASR